MLNYITEDERNQSEMLRLFKQLSRKEQIMLIGRLEVMVEKSAQATASSGCKIINLFQR
ncbi:hypothetical protein [Anaerotruncus colihominis]|uniref:hypothetical protein n=1 Tax=Anaerotruncus colihominis TaxID=169435 RepID=UPI0013A635DD|nr:hypothetical protein [Anaerotruncus colihominis]MBS4989861.1 hypothetical protein [Anaerotruncus colihominis]MCQ4734477.1 hypothetical protein [Anaerotruncus colihominis]